MLRGEAVGCASVLWRRDIFVALSGVGVAVWCGLALRLGAVWSGAMMTAYLELRLCGIARCCVACLELRCDSVLWNGGCAVIWCGVMWCGVV